MATIRYLCLLKKSICMIKLLLSLVLLLLFPACREEPAPPSDTIDPAIVGTWQVDVSQTITGVRMLTDGTLECTGEQTDTVTFFGVPGTPVTSYLFGRQENVIDIRQDNKIKVFLINSRGGVTVTQDHVPYYVRQDTLFRQSAAGISAHLYHQPGDSLVIERIPDSRNNWTYIRSKYFRREL